MYQFNCRELQIVRFFRNPQKDAFHYFSFQFYGKPLHSNKTKWSTSANLKNLIKNSKMLEFSVLITSSLVMLVLDIASNISVFVAPLFEHLKNLLWFNPHHILRDIVIYPFYRETDRLRKVTTTSLRPQSKVSTVPQTDGFQGSWFPDLYTNHVIKFPPK